MDISLEIRLSDEEVERLKISLGSDADINRIATVMARAGAAEILAQATGRVVPGSLREERLFRIFLLLEAGISLAEVQVIVAAIFKETPGRARSLVETAIARYDIELRESADHRIGELLEAGTWDEDRWSVELPIGYVRDRVLEAADDTALPDVNRAQRGSIYRFPDETYQAVRKKFGLAKRPKPKK